MSDERAVLRELAWRDCIMWAIGDPDVRAWFEADTGHRWKAASSPLEVLIDKATGHGEEYVKAFVPWFNANVWGDPVPAAAEAAWRERTSAGEREGETE